jgi:hypothetical protein
VSTLPTLRHAGGNEMRNALDMGAEAANATLDAT